MKSKLRWTALLLLAALIVVSLVVAEDSSDEDVSAIAEHMHGRHGSESDSELAGDDRRPEWCFLGYAGACR